MTKVVVGQKVWMKSGPDLSEGVVIGLYREDGYVLRSAPGGDRIEVEPLQMAGRLGGMKFALHFRYTGEQCGVSFSFGSGWDQYDRRPLCT